MRNKIHLNFLFSAIVFTLLLLIGCNSTAQPEQIPVVLVDEINVEQEDTVEPSITTEDSGYPSVSLPIHDPGYPVQNPLLEHASSEPQNPERTLPAAQQDAAVVGGVLIWEVTDVGFIPLDPSELKLAEVVINSKNEIAYIRDSSESPNAQLFPTGVFVFDNVPPGKYGLVVDVGYTKFPIASETEEYLLIEVVAGEVLDLGQIITELPDA